MSDATTMGEHNLAVLAEQRHERIGDYEALFFEGTWLTSTQIHERASRVAGGLRAHGVEPGDRVVVMTMNTPEVFVSYQAIWRAGAVVTPVIFLQTVPELRHILTDSGATAAIISAELVDLFRGAAGGRNGDPAPQRGEPGVGQPGRAVGADRSGGHGRSQFRTRTMGWPSLGNGSEWWSSGGT